jgi:hypothetical protein
MSSRTVATAAAIATALAASPAPAATSDKAYDLHARFARAMETCWFNSGDPAFAAYVYSPEPNAANGPRILIVPKTSPTSNPLLVVDIDPTGNHVNVYGPLTGSAAVKRIGADLKRWMAGSEACS